MKRFIQRIFPAVILLVLLFSSCEDKHPFLLPYLAETSLHYTVTHDTVTLIFPKKPIANHYKIGLAVQGGGYYYCNYELFGVIHGNRIDIPLHIPDSVQIDSTHIAVWTTPLNGKYFQKGEYNTYYQYQDFSTYAMDSTPGMLALRPSRVNDTIYYFPTSFLKGSDSVYYKERLQRFYQRQVK